LVDASTRQRAIDLLDEGQFSDWYGGTHARAFEEAFAAYHGVRHAIAVNSGTAALHAALAAADVGPGDEVILSTASFVTAASAVLQQGAEVVLGDIEPAGLTLDAAALPALITPRTRAILPVHLYGYPCNMSQICGLAAQHGLTVIEDCGQAHGARRAGRPVGTFGHLACFSFASPRKHIAVGEGGMILTNDDRLAEECRQVVNKGKRDGWRTHRRMGYSYVMGEFEAILGLGGLARLDSEIERRRAAAAVYVHMLRASGLEVDPDPADCTHVYFRKVIRLPDEFAPWRDWFVEALRAEHVSAVPPHVAIHDVHWFATAPPYPPGYPFLSSSRSGGGIRKTLRLPRADREWARLLDVETGPGMTPEDAKVSAEGILKVWHYLQDHRNTITRLVID
jgi:perosamine synthetase